MTRWMDVMSSSIDALRETTALGAEQALLLAVADGQGSVGGVDPASVVVRRALELMMSAASWDGEWARSQRADANPGSAPELLERLETIGLQCNDALAELVENSRPEGFGTTLTLAHLAWPRASLLHIGDSRCYLYRDSRLYLLTRDHTLANQLADTGSADPRATDGSLASYILVNSLDGRDAPPSFETRYVDLFRGDTLLLCTDGLTRAVNRQQIVHALVRGETARDACQLLLGAAAESANDNLTLLIARSTDVSF